MREPVIVAEWESGHSPVLPDESIPTLHDTAARAALAACGLRPEDVDGVASGSAPPEEVAFALGAPVRWLDGTALPNASSVLLVTHAAAAIRAGAARVVVVVLGESLASAVGVERVVPLPDPSSPVGQFLQPYGAGPQGAFALGALRYLHRHGLDRDALAEVAVAQRRWAHTNPAARYRDLVEVDDVLASPVVAHPLHRLMCSATTDYAGALVLARADIAASLGCGSVEVRGGGVAAGPPLISQLADVAAPACLAEASARALAGAGIGIDAVDHAMVFDGFAHCVLMGLDAIGACPPGGAAELVAAGETLAGGRLPTNTNGGFLSHRHGDMAMLVESVRQLEGRAATPVAGVEASLVLGVGPCFSGAAAAVLGR